MRNVLLRKSLLFAGILCMSVSSMAQVTEKWVKRENGDPNTPDRANALVVDKNNNVIVTGQSQGKGTDDDFATIKYNDAGDTKWVKRYNGPGTGTDQATAIAADSNCNIYVTGHSLGSGTGNDFATIKYDIDGNTKWVKRYDGPGNSSDAPVAIAVDNYGNVYVTGSSISIENGSNITTIKYDKDGNTKWVRILGSASPTAIAVDKDGNVYVTGSGNGGIATIKYNKDGIQQWVSTFNGPLNSGTANALALDDKGNVYVTGLIRTTLPDEDGVSESDIATIKYNTAGVQQWAAIYNNSGHDAARAIAVDAAGNVYITGVTGLADEPVRDQYVTIKYNATGVQQWAQLFPPTGFGGTANDLVLDAAGNVYITGGLSINGEELDYVTIKYNTNGVQQWVATYDGPGNFVDVANAIGLDKNGNVYVTGFSYINQPDYATIKYNNSGVQKWVRRYNGPGDQLKGGPDIANALALDAAGNVHVTGGITRLITGEDYTTFKYKTEDGDRIWKRTYSGPGIGPDEAKDIAVDALGNVYATGRSDGGGTNDDYATVKYDAAGNSKWGKRYNGPGNSVDQATAIAADGNGNVYVTGQSRGSNGTFDYATIKYDKDGNQKWVRRYDGPGQGQDLATDIAVDASGNVYVTGQSIGSGTFEDYATIKYDANGNQLWVARYNNSRDEARALAIDASGNVYVTGRSVGSGTLEDYATIKYDANGNQLWVARYNGPDNTLDEANALAIDASGNVYVTGGSNGSGTFSDYATIKYNAAGVEQWVARYDAANAGDEANALALDAQGNVYVTGGSRPDNNSFPDYATIKYNATGIQQWVARYNGPGNSIDIANDISLDAAGNVYVTGQSEGNLTMTDYATIKYEQTPLITARSATDPAQNNPVIEQRESAKLTVKAFPNAFTQYINLQWSGSDKPVTITITDEMGRLVEKRVGLASSGTVQTGSNFGKGIYFAEIVQGEEKIVLKLVKK